VADERKKFKDKTTKELKNDLLEARERGTTELAFLGGESTIRPDIIELVRFAKEHGFKHVKLTTNGRMLAYPEFVKQLVEAGITKVLFSFHGHNAEIHDDLTTVPGSFSQMMQGVKNIKEYKNVVIETNTTITKLNYKDLPNMAKLFIKLGMLSSEFIFVFPYGNSLRNFYSIVPKYSEAAPHMKKALDIGKNSKTKVLMRYVPFCILEGYEQYIAELYDPPEREQIGPGVETLDVIKERKTIDRSQVQQCSQCRYEFVCEGPWKVYPKFYGSDEFNPIAGEKIKSVNEVIADGGLSTNR
jgi:MoaA/NifB/PqqE/SkfB family radical SAM enzyme